MPIPQELNEFYWVLGGVAFFWLLDILYKNSTDRNDAYRYILGTLTVIPFVFPWKYLAFLAICRFWYATFRLGPRMGLLFNAHYVLMVTYITSLDGEITTWFIIFSVLDLTVLWKQVPLRTFLWVVIRVIAFGIYALFLSGTLFNKIYFGFIWFVQIFMLPSL